MGTHYVTLSVRWSVTLLKLVLESYPNCIIAPALPYTTLFKYLACVSPVHCRSVCWLVCLSTIHFFGSFNWKVNKQGWIHDRWAGALKLFGKYFNQPTNSVTYRVACMRLKRFIWQFGDSITGLYPLGKRLRKTGLFRVVVGGLMGDPRIQASRYMAPGNG